jgi:hypothetical protein
MKDVQMKPTKANKLGILQIFLSVAQQPNAGQGRLILEVSGSPTMTKHSRWDSWMNGRPVADPCVTYNTHKRRRPCIPADSNAQSQQAVGYRPSP